MSSESLAPLLPWNRRRVLAHRAALIGLAPVLLAQGRHVRRVTPRLPEPEGPRSGREGGGPLLRLLIAGDSAAAGVGVEHQRQALSGQLLAPLSQRFDVQWQLHATTGHTTADVLHRLAQLPAQTFDVAVISLGVNDVTGGIRMQAWLRAQHRLAELLRARFGVQHVFLSTVGPMDRMTALPHPLRWMLGTRAKRFNAQLLHAVQHWPCCEVVQLMLDDTPGAIAADGFHPGWLTYQRWAGHVAARILERFGAPPDAR